MEEYGVVIILGNLVIASAKVLQQLERDPLDRGLIIKRDQ